MQILFEDCSVPYLEYSGREVLEGIMYFFKKVLFSFIYSLPGP